MGRTRSSWNKPGLEINGLINYGIRHLWRSHCKATYYLYFQCSRMLKKELANVYTRNRGCCLYFQILELNGCDLDINVKSKETGLL